MTNQNYIEFKRERNLGEIINDSFAFIRYTYKDLFKAIVKLVGPILILLILAIAGYMYLVFGTLKSGASVLNGGAFNNGIAILGTMLLGFLLLFLSVLYYSFFYSTVNYCIKSYIDHEGKIDQEEVKQNVRKNWGKYLGLAFLIILIFMAAAFIGIMPATILGVFIGATLNSISLTFITMFLGYLPLIYLYVPMTLVFAVAIFNNYSSGSSISYSFKLVRHHWWKSFLTLLVMGIIFFVAGLIFQFPVLIYSLIKGMTMGKEMTLTSITDFDAFFDWGYILLTLFSYIGRFLLYALMVICGTFIFFNLNEKKNQTGAFETIESLGNDNTEV